MNASEIVHHLLGDQLHHMPQTMTDQSFAPINIALCKYWGKRDTQLNLPYNASLSVALPSKGAFTHLTVIDHATDIILFNQNELAPHTTFAKRLIAYLNLFRPYDVWRLKIDITSNIPVAAGFASSAAGFASIILALNQLLNWQCSLATLSILARLGSGSATRSFWKGFVEWPHGTDSNGMDSHGQPIATQWPALRVGLLTLDHTTKPLSSREAMQQTVRHSRLYETWPKQATQDLVRLKQAIQDKDFACFGGTAENNALAMHATMLSSWPPICYWLPETLAIMHRIWQLRADGLPLFFTEDAGPNLKLLFLEQTTDLVKQHFPTIEIIAPFETSSVI